MAFKELKENSEAIKENSKSYIESSVAYYKLLGFKAAMKSTTLLIKFLIITFCLLLFMLFISIAGALYMGQIFNSYPLGFFSVAGIYLIFGFFIYLLRHKIVERPIIEKFSDIFFNE